MPEKTWQQMREEVFKRDNYICQYCGTKEGPFHADHVYPASKGGETTVNNLVTACPKCNMSKNAKVGIWPRKILIREEVVVQKEFIEKIVKKIEVIEKIKEVEVIKEVEKTRVEKRLSIGLTLTALGSFLLIIFYAVIVLDFPPIIVAAFPFLITFAGFIFIAKGKA